MDLLIQYGLAERRPSGSSPRRRRAPAPRPSGPRAAAEPPPRRRRFTTSDEDVAGWRRALAGQAWPPTQLRASQRDLWHRHTASDLELGLDRGRITVPIRARGGALQGVLRYAPTRAPGSPKMIALPGSALGLIPSPAVDASRWILLVEGPPDMIAARSVGLPAIAIPGDYAWETDWASELAGRRVTVLMDCDDAGRTAARRIAADLKNAAETVQVADLAPGRSDSYDLTDWLADHRHLLLSTLSALLGRPLQG